MYDKNGLKIKRGSYIRYGGQIYRVMWAHFGKIAISDGEAIQTLRVQLIHLRKRIVNIEVLRVTKNGTTQIYAY